MIRALTTTPNISNLERVWLYNSLDLSEEVACECLAEFIAAATQLTKLGILGHTGREVKVSITTGNEGIVTVMDVKAGT